MNVDQYLFAGSDGKPRFRIVDSHPRDDAAGDIKIEEKGTDALDEEVWLPIPRRGTSFRVPYMMMLGILRELKSLRKEVKKSRKPASRPHLRSQKSEGGDDE